MLHVDHVHGSNRYRGLICSTCNVAIGMAKDNVELLKKIIAYLETR
jgi:hypothetical protein